MKRVLVFTLVLGCAPPVTIEVKDRLVGTVAPARVDSTQLCNGAPFGKGTVDFAKDLKEAGIDLSQGCLRSGRFELAAEYDPRPGNGCSVVTGSAFITGVLLEAACSTTSSATQTLRATCQSNELKVADGTQVFNALNDCLNEFERTQVEPLRKLINSCKPTAMSFTVEGYCSADLCFAADIKIGVQTRNVVAQLGGTCP